MNERKYKRIEKPYIVRFRTREDEYCGTVSTDWDMVSLKDLSAGGALFNYNNNLGIGSLLDLKIDISRSIPTIHCVGKVTRIEEFQPHSILRIAAEFTEIGVQDREMINILCLMA